MPSLYPRNPAYDEDLPPCFNCGGDAIRDWMGMSNVTIVCTECGCSVHSSAGPAATEELWRERLVETLKGIRK